MTTVEEVLIHSQPTRFLPGFHEWLLENGPIWEEFKRQADSLCECGWRHYSARTILHWIRHHTAIHEGPGKREWKVNNNISPDLARLYIDLHPERAKLFEFRTMRSSRRAA